MFMKVQVSSIWKKKKICNDRQQDSNPRQEVQVHHANHWITKDLLEDREIIIEVHITSTPIQKKN